MYHYDQYDNSIVIDGFEKGIAESPHAGISDMRNINIISVPNEASVNFATQKISSSLITGNLFQILGGNILLFDDPLMGLEVGQAIYFTGLSDVTKGITNNTVYWVKTLVRSPNANLTISTAYLHNTELAVTASNTTGVINTYITSIPKYFSSDSRGNYFMVDYYGRVWSNLVTTGTNYYWTYTGNTVDGSCNGSGLVYYEASDATEYLFVFRASAIDYGTIAGGTITWTYGWKPSDASTGNANGYLKSSSGSVNSHEAMIMPTNQVCYCDGRYIGRFYEKNPAVAFVPTTLATYVNDNTALLPSNDVSQCLTYLGTNIMVGGARNVIYPWNGVDTTFNYPILLAENNIVKMITVNTNTYVFVGNRGRIYITNGSQAQLYKKVPDHISGTVEPYFKWGGATSIKNQLYFGVQCFSNDTGLLLDYYGGVWGIDIDTSALRLAQKLSYGTYAGYPTALIPRDIDLRGGTYTFPSGAGLFIGWDNGTSYPRGTGGIDKTITDPYDGIISSATIATIETDLIPIGTFNNPRNFQQLEVKLTKPLVANESIVVKSRTDFSQSFGSAILTIATAGQFSSSASVDFKNAQWIQFQINMYSTATTPSYVRLREMRITGLVQ
jgi:hypothetical protein